MDKCRLGRVAPVVVGVDGEHRRGMARLVESRSERVMRSDALGSAELEPAYQHKRGRLAPPPD